MEGLFFESRQRCCPPPMQRPSLSMPHIVHSCSLSNSGLSLLALSSEDFGGGLSHIISTLVHVRAQEGLFSAMILAFGAVLHRSRFRHRACVHMLYYCREALNLCSIVCLCFLNFISSLSPSRSYYVVASSPFSLLSPSLFLGDFSFPRTEPREYVCVYRV